jgi:hypothetical protein
MDIYKPAPCSKDLVQKSKVFYLTRNFLYILDSVYYHVDASKIQIDSKWLPSLTILSLFNCNSYSKQLFQTSVNS